MTKVVLVVVVDMAILLGPTLHEWSSDEVDVVVYRSKKCPCVGEWVEQLQNEGYSVDVKQPLFVSAIRKKYGVPDEFTSCHTSIAGQYFIEGHVSSESVRYLFQAQPPIVGIALRGNTAMANINVTSDDGTSKVYSVGYDGRYSLFDRK